MRYEKSIVIYKQTVKLLLTKKGKTIYTTLIYTTSSRAMPKNLKYLGNKKVIVPKDDYGIFLNTFDICNNMNFVLWKRFESSMIENYFGHNLKEYEFYKEHIWFG